MSNLKADNEGTENIIRMYRSTAIIMIFIEVTGVLSMLIDGIITSRFLGIDVYSAISMLRPFTSILLTLSGFLSIGCCLVCSSLIGSGDQKGSNEVFNLSLLLALAFSVLLIIGCLFTDYLFYKERITWKNALGVVCGIASILLIIW